MLAASAALALSLVAAQTGDDCDDPRPLSGTASLVLDHLNFTASGHQGGGGCSAVSAAMPRDQFFRWSATASGDYAFLTLGALVGTFDTSIALYDGVDCSAPCLTASAPPNSLDALVHARAMAGDELLVQVGGWYAGSFHTIPPSLQVFRLAGDRCDAPIPVTGPGAFEVPIRAHSASGPLTAGACGAFPTGLPDTFLLWTATADGDYWFDTYGSPMQSHVAAYAGDCAGACLGSASPASSLYGRARLLVPGVAAGDQILVQVAADWDPIFSGAMDLSVYRDSCAVVDAYEPNDDVQGAPLIGPGTYTDLTLAHGADDVDVFRFRADPGEAVYFDFTAFDGGAPSAQILDSSGQWIAYAGPWTTTLPDVVNNYPWTTDLYLSIGQQSGEVACTGYAFELDVRDDPCRASGDDALEPNDDCASAAPLGPGVHTGLFISEIDADHYALVAPPQSTLRVELGDAAIALDLTLRGNCGSAPIAYGNGNVLQWTNASSSAAAVTLSLLVPPSGPYGNRCTDYTLRVSGGAPVGTAYCDPAAPNSNGVAAELRAQGSVLAADAALTLVAEGLTPGYSAFALGSRSRDVVPALGGGPGTLCLGAPIVRFLDSLAIAPLGAPWIQTLDLRSIPEPPLYATVAQPGDTWNFQVWYRDFVGGVPTSNLSNAVEVLLQ